MIFAGIDGGSRAVKVVLYHAEKKQLLACAVHDQGVHHNAIATQLFDQLLAQHSLSRSDVRRIIATGYARNLIKLAHATVTEITCHAVGVRHLCPDAMTIVEIGGQDSKLLRLDPSGSVRDFSMNDRCAAGTGRFLEVVAARLDTTLDQLAPLAAQATSPAPISSTCVVFAETEIIGLLASGTPSADIVAGVQNAIATRLAAMAGPNLTPPIYFTGGVALLPGMLRALESTLNLPLTPVPSPQLTGALGAAILASRT